MANNPVISEAIQGLNKVLSFQGGDVEKVKNRIREALQQLGTNDSPNPES